jgi:DNA-binding NarL/FixJ family response regulator
MNVYIVDDSALLRDRLKTMLLTSTGIEIAGEADNPHDAVEGILRLHPDVVILDIRMPGGNGIDVIEKVKEKGSLPTLIVFTNYPHRQYREKCMDLGADFFFEKSQDFEKVPEVLERLLQVSPLGATENQGF